MGTFSTVALGVCATTRLESGSVGIRRRCPAFDETNTIIPDWGYPYRYVLRCVILVQLVQCSPRHRFA